MNQLFHICKDDPILKSAVSYIIANNTGNTNPYHSFEHGANVFLHCVEAIEYHELPEKEAKNLLIAALFHDFNHSAGEMTDDVNISNAKMGVEEWAKEETDGIIDVDLIYSMIDATQFPYQVDSNALNLPQQILRDADMGSIFTDNWFQTIMLGLSGEAGTGFEAFIEQQKNFMTNMKANTEWFRKTKMPMLQEKLDDLNMYAEFIYKV